MKYDVRHLCVLALAFAGNVDYELHVKVRVALKDESTHFGPANANIYSKQKEVESKLVAALAGVLKVAPASIAISNTQASRIQGKGVLVLVADATVRASQQMLQDNVAPLLEETMFNQVLEQMLNFQGVQLAPDYERGSVQVYSGKGSIGTLVPQMRIVARTKFAARLSVAFVACGLFFFGLFIIYKSCKACTQALKRIFCCVCTLADGNSDDETSSSSRSPSRKRYTKIATKEDDMMMAGAIGVGQGSSASNTIPIRPSGGRSMVSAPIVVMADTRNTPSDLMRGSINSGDSLADDILGDDVV
jgi:hypothetical protein